MANYRLIISKRFLKNLEKLDARVVQRIWDDILKLSENPRPKGCKKLRGVEDLYRIRVGEWRVIYSVDDSRKIVEILFVRHRRDVYRGL